VYLNELVINVDIPVAKDLSVCFLLRVRCEALFVKSSLLIFLRRTLAAKLQRRKVHLMVQMVYTTMTNNFYKVGRRRHSVVLLSQIKMMRLQNMADLGYL
jgi:hypothetical protein